MRRNRAGRHATGVGMSDKKFLYAEQFESYQKSIPDILDAVNVSAVFSRQKHILLKPNLVNTSAFPVTTSPKMCQAVIEYIQNCSDALVTIAEGCGDAYYDTDDVFQQLGYTRLADKFGVRLVDLNQDELIKVSRAENTIYSSMFLPRIIFESYLFSLPVLKAHSLAAVTGTRKNMMGVLPPKYYAKGGSWKKSVFHDQLDDSIIELNRYRTPDLTLLDASVGLCVHHLGAPECRPPIGQLVVSDNALELDQYAARLLGLDPKTIPHIIIE